MSNCNCGTIPIPSGYNGWSPILEIEVVNSTTEVLRLSSWTGGTGNPPSIPTNNYITATGFGSIGSAINIRGTNGTNGTNGVSILFSYNDLIGVENSAAIGTSVLSTYTVPSNTLSVNGDELDIDIFYNYNNNDQVDISLNFGGGTIYSYTDFGSVDTNNILNIKIARISSNSQLWIISKIFSDSSRIFKSLFVAQANSIVDLTSSNVFEIIADNIAYGASQVILKRMVIKKYSV